jgi:hypothetical protein
MINKINKQWKCQWCDDMVDQDKSDLFLFFNKDSNDIREHYMFERPICKQCQEIFDAADDSTIKKKYSKGGKN